jgi:flagellar assembly factor FliW
VTGALMTRTLSFTAPPFGLEPHVEFALAPVDGAVGLFRLTAAADETLRLFVLDAAVHLPDYQPEITTAQQAELELNTVDASDAGPADADHAGGTGAGAVSADVFVVVTPGAGTSTVNLLAPIVVNGGTGRCQQVILADSTLSLREPLLPRA